MKPLDQEPNAAFDNWFTRLILCRLLGGLAILVMLALIHLILGG